MMKQEFEELAGYEVTWEDYTNIIEPMYMAVELSKAEFVKVIDKKRFALRSFDKLISTMKAYAKDLKDTCTHYTDYHIKKELDKTIDEYVARKYAGSASYMVEDKQVQSCYYPIRVKVFGSRKYNDYETIELF